MTTFEQKVGRFIRSKAYYRSWMVLCALLCLKATLDYSRCYCAGHTFAALFNLQCATFQFMFCVFWILVHDAGGIGGFLEQWLRRRR